MSDLQRIEAQRQEPTAMDLVRIAEAARLRGEDGIDAIVRAMGGRSYDARPLVREIHVP